MWQEEDLPVAPTILPGSMIHTPREVHLRTSASGALPDHMAGSRTSQEGLESADDSFTSVRRSMTAKVKRSSSVLLAA